MLRKDLDKLKYLSELPEMFKGALEEYNKEPEKVIQGSEDRIESKDLEAVFGKTLGLYEEYSDILLVYKKTKFMQDLYNDIKTYVQKVKAILTSELEKIKNQDLVFIESESSMHKICPVYLKRLRDILKFLVLIVVTQNQSNDKDVLKMRNQMVNNYRLTYQKIKLRQLETLIQNIRSFKM